MRIRAWQLCIATLALSLMMGVSALSIAAQDKNPYAGDAKVAKLGEFEFRANCAFCHGLGAHGGGRGGVHTKGTRGGAHGGDAGGAHEGGAGGGDENSPRRVSFASGAQFVTFEVYASFNAYETRGHSQPGGTADGSRAVGLCQRRRGYPG